MTDAKRAQFAEALCIYDFDVAKLTEPADRKKKDAELKVFEQLVASDLDAFLPLVREQLRSRPAASFFRYDGARLLAMHSQDAADWQTAANALADSPFAGLNPSAFFQLAHQLAVQGADVSADVDRMLDTPGFEVFLVEHVMTLSQQVCCAYCTMPMREELYVDRFAARLRRESDPTAVRSMLVCLHYSVAAKAQQAMREFAQTTKDDELRKQALEAALFAEQKDLPAVEIQAKRALLFPFLEDFVARRYDNSAYDFDTYSAQAPYLVKHEDYERIKELRRKQAARVSDEALEEIAFLTQLMELAFTAGK